MITIPGVARACTKKKPAMLIKPRERKNTLYCLICMDARASNKATIRAIAETFVTTRKCSRGTMISIFCLGCDNSQYKAKAGAQRNSKAKKDCQYIVGLVRCLTIVNAWVQLQTSLH